MEAPTSNVPRSLARPRTYSRRPEQRREGGAAVFVPNLRASEPVYKQEASHVTGASEEAAADLPEQGSTKTLPAKKARKKRQWK